MSEPVKLVIHMPRWDIPYECDQAIRSETTEPATEIPARRMRMLQEAALRYALVRMEIP